MNSKDLIKKVEKLYDDRITYSNDAVKAAGQWGSDEYVPLICDEICKKINIQKNKVGSYQPFAKTIKDDYKINRPMLKLCPFVYV